MDAHRGTLTRVAYNSSRCPSDYSPRRTFHGLIRKHPIIKHLPARTRQTDTSERARNDRNSQACIPIDETRPHVEIHKARKQRDWRQHLNQYGIKRTITSLPRQIDICRSRRE